MITKEFLINSGWQLKEEKPLLLTFSAIKNSDLTFSIGKYGHISVIENDFNGNAGRIFSTVNAFITDQDYEKIMDLLGIDWQSLIN